MPRSAKTKATKTVTLEATPTYNDDVLELSSSTDDTLEATPLSKLPSKLRLPDLKAWGFCRQLIFTQVPYSRDQTPRLRFGPLFMSGYYTREALIGSVINYGNVSIVYCHVCVTTICLVDESRNKKNVN